MIVAVVTFLHFSKEITELFAIRDVNKLNLANLLLLELVGIHPNSSLVVFNSAQGILRGRIEIETFEFKLSW